MGYLSLLISLLVGGVAYLLWPVKSRNNIEERLIASFGPPLISWTIITLPMIFIMKGYNFSDEEYRSYYVRKVVHEDPWDEWIHRTCTRTVKVGKTTHTQTYDCSYRKYHPDYWYKEGNDGSRISINRDEYDRIRRLWGTPEIFVEMNRKYYKLDGDAQEYQWDERWQTCENWTETHKYENRIKGSESILKGKHITPEEAATIGLKEYGKVPIIGGIDSVGLQRMNYINSYYGRNKEIHIFILLWNASLYGPGISEDQKAYWEGGNKNELVICIGVDSVSRKVRWSDSFSWQETPELDVRIKDWLIANDSLDIPRLSFFIEDNIRLWKRRSFEEFNYIQYFLTTDQLLWIFVVTLVVTVTIEVLVMRLITT